MACEVKFGYGSVTKNDGIFGGAISGQDNLRTGWPLKVDANGNYVVVLNANDKIVGFSYWGANQTVTENGLQKEDKYEVTESNVVVRTTNYVFDSYRTGDAFNMIKNGYMDVVISADVAANDDVYFDLTTHLYTNVSKNNIKVGNSKFTAPAANGDKVTVYFSL